MLGCNPAAAADSRAVKDREIHLAAEHVMDLGGLVDDLVHRDKAERHLPPIDDRAKAATGGADRHAGQCRFGDRRRPDPFGAELAEQRRQRVGRHVKDLGIAPHLFGDRLDRGLVIAQLSHPSLPAEGKRLF